MKSHINVKHLLDAVEIDALDWDCPITVVRECSLSEVSAALAQPSA